jgi:2'-5' RNA ligase
MCSHAAQQPILAFREHELAEHYDAMWHGAFPAISAGEVICDPQFASNASDPRRGLTLIARLSPETNRRMTEALATLAAIEPGQYCHPQADLHLTILSLYTVSENWQPCAARLAEYREAVAEALESAPSFTVDSAGITLSKAAVVAQGFPRDGTLNGIRDRIRATFRRRGLGDSLDQRYRLVTAHSTMLRFVQPLQNPTLFSERLLDLRGEYFGASTIDSLDLVFNDWYMSSQSLFKIDSYPLG